MAKKTTTLMMTTLRLVTSPLCELDFPQGWYMAWVHGVGSWRGPFLGTNSLVSDVGATPHLILQVRFNGVQFHILNDFTQLKILALQSAPTPAAAPMHELVRTAFENKTKVTVVPFAELAAEGLEVVGPVSISTACISPSFPIFLAGVGVRVHERGDRVRFLVWCPVFGCAGEIG
jgi:hypothetical protein